MKEAERMQQLQANQKTGKKTSAPMNDDQFNEQMDQVIDEVDV